MDCKVIAFELCARQMNIENDLDEETRRDEK